MEAAPDLPPVQHASLPSLHELLQPSFMAQPNDTHTAGQNYDRDNNFDMPSQPPSTDNPFTPPLAESQPPPPEIPLPPPDTHQTALQSTVPPPPLPQDNSELPNTPPPPPGNEQNSNQERHRSRSRSRSGSEHSGSEDEGEPEPGDGFVWQPLHEDKTVPCEDELKYIETKNEHSALDYKYWEKKVFFNVDDPEIVPGASGRIDWLVEKFNGTKEDPNKEHIMKSDIVRIGDYDWRIKMFPKGNDTDFISVYIECATMQDENFSATEEFAKPPFPIVSGMDKPKKRRSVAAQVAVVMYNPEEPRTYEYHYDAHQFTKSQNDYGWTRFTRHSRREFSYRQHGQRQAILRNDKLAFSAYIRIVHDPTGCMWSHGEGSRFNESIALTGLRPFSPLMPLYAAEIPLLHFAPFRNFISRYSETKIAFWFNTLLWKMFSRKKSSMYGHDDMCVESDTITWLRYAMKWIGKETDAATVEKLVGKLDPQNGAAISENRLKTAHVDSVQEAIQKHPTAIETPQFLTLELERQEFQREKRRWRKITNKVNMEDKITVGGTLYSLFSFATHCGDLESNKFNVYVRPHGPGNLWYQYTNGETKCLTQKQAVERLSGIDDTDKEKPSSSSHASKADPFRLSHRSPFGEDRERIEVAHVVFYVRDDVAPAAFNPVAEEVWEVPEKVKKGIPPTFEGVVEPPPATAVYEHFAESVQQDEDNAVAVAEAAAEQVEAHPPPPPPEDPEPPSRRDSFETEAGYATPNCWAMDGEDVIMSDADSDIEPESDTTTTTNSNPASGPNPTSNSEAKKDKAKKITTNTIDLFGRDYYHGEWLNNAYHGSGHLISMTGDEYTGTFLAGQKSGHGTQVYATTGNTYVGSWSENAHHGQGTLTEASTGNVFEGGWKEGRKHGKFVLTGEVTEDDKGCCSICYDREISTAFYDCGHVVACKECAKRVEVCPVCRKRVLARLELFGVKLNFE